MTFNKYYEIYKVRNPGKLDNIDKKVLKDFWDYSHNHNDELEETIVDLKRLLRKAENDLKTYECEYNSALCMVAEIKGNLDKFGEKLIKKE